jgi:hypothetical protein
LFWDAWRATFKKELVLKSFAAKGIWPMDLERILKRFEDKTLLEAASGPLALKDTDWRQIDHLVRSAVKDTRADVAKELS